MLPLCIFPCIHGRCKLVAYSPSVDLNEHNLHGIEADAIHCQLHSGAYPVTVCVCVCIHLHVCAYLEQRGK